MAEEQKQSTQTVTPWEVSATEGIDYDKLIRDFGSSAIDQVRQTH